jgi:hypothetical protein
MLEELKGSILTQIELCTVAILGMRRTYPSSQGPIIVFRVLVHGGRVVFDHDYVQRQARYGFDRG